MRKSRTLRVAAFFAMMAMLAVMLQLQLGGTANAAPGDNILASAADDGTQGNGFSTAPRISTDGRYVTFASESDNLDPLDTDTIRDIYRKDLQTGDIALVSVAADGTTKGNQGSTVATMSADGRYVIFRSQADNLVLADTSTDNDIFWYSPDKIE